MNITDYNSTYFYTIFSMIFTKYGIMTVVKVRLRIWQMQF